jgi:hypothetical protein
LLERLEALERSKREEPLASETFLDYARQTEELARLVFRWSGLQREMAEGTHDAAVSGRTSSRSLLQVRPRPLDQILAAWREAQLRLQIAQPGSPEARRAVDEIERLRDEYHAIAEDKMHGNGAHPETPPA